MAHLMGHDPAADWLTQPFLRDRNALLAAAEGGFGTVRLDEIDWSSELAPQPAGTFFAVATDPESRRHRLATLDVRAGAHLSRPSRPVTSSYAGEYILLQDGEVVWHSPTGTLGVSRRTIAAAKPNHALWFKFVDPEEREGEHYEIYERALAHLQEREKQGGRA